MDRYIVIELRGRLGNQLFQFASGLGIARALRAELCFERRNVSDSDLLLPKLIGALYREATPRELRRVGSLPFRMDPVALFRFIERRIMRFARRVRAQADPMIRLGKDSGEFHPELFAIDPPAFISGYLQNEQYFSAIEPEVFAAFQWPTERRPACGPSDRKVAVSFRRADANTRGCALPLEFYERAFSLVRAVVADPTFVLFGDDAAFVEMFADRVIRDGHDVLNALDNARDPISQLRMFAECEHAILSNSTFAWWGAWLGDCSHEGSRLVIAPSYYGGIDPRTLRAQWHAVRPETGVSSKTEEAEESRPASGV